MTLYPAHSRFVRFRSGVTSRDHTPRGASRGVHYVRCSSVGRALQVVVGSSPTIGHLLIYRQAPGDFLCELGLFGSSLSLRVLDRYVSIAWKVFHKMKSLENSYSGYGESLYPFFLYSGFVILCFAGVGFLI